MLWPRACRRCRAVWVPVVADVVVVAIARPPCV
jgi:hypothetical protein